MTKAVKVRALRSFSGQMGTPEEGDVVVLDEAQAEELVNLGFVERVGGKVSAEAEKNV